MSRLLAILCATLTLVAMTAAAAAADAIRSVPGGLYVHPLPATVVSAKFAGRRLLVWRNRAVVGIPLSAEPGDHELTIEHDDGRVETVPFTVADKQYTEQRLTIENPKMVNPDPESLERIRSESKRMREAYASYRTGHPPVSRFEVPVDGPMSSSFGRRRVLNGQPRSPHSGLDIAAPTGTPILSPAPGRVSLTGNFYFNGNTVFVDHGGGLVSMVCHLSEIGVSEGEEVEQGALLGLVGETGRVTGAHLHWSVSLNGNRVDPVQVMALFEEDQSDIPRPASGS